MSKGVINRLSTVPYLLYNFAGLAVFTHGYSEIIARVLPPELEKAGHHQFLTNLSLIFTIFTVASNIIAAPFTDKKDHFVSRLNLNMNAAALVLETLVTTIYWTLKLFVTHMIVLDSIPKEKYIPLGLDLCIHFYPVLFLSIDYYFIKKTSFKLSFIHTVALVCTATATYWFILESLITPESKYPYPFLNVETEKRIVIFAAVSVFGLIAYQLYEFLHTIVQSAVYEFEEEFDAKKTN